MRAGRYADAGAQQGFGPVAHATGPAEHILDLVPAREALAHDRLRPAPGRQLEREVSRSYEKGLTYGIFRNIQVELVARDLIEGGVLQDGLARSERLACELLSVGRRPSPRSSQQGLSSHGTPPPHA